MMQESLQRNIANFLHSGIVNNMVQIFVDAQGYIHIVYL